MSKHPKIFRWLLKETQFSKLPTDVDLDIKINYLSWMLKSLYPTFWFIFKSRIHRFFKYRFLSFRFWLQLLRNVIIIALIAALGGASVYYLVVFTKDRIDPPTKEVKYVYFSELKSYEQLVQDIGKKESGNNWQCTPNGTYIGWFQFGPSAFEACKTIGLDIDKYGRWSFLKDPNAQKTWFAALMRLNKKSLDDVIGRWNGKPSTNIKGFESKFTITESGILMGAHLVGASACREYFESGGKVIPVDGNGVPVTKYIEEFSGYDIDAIIYK